MAAADLANIIASNGSHESFHSTYSNPKPAVDARVAAAIHATEPEDAALQLHDVDTFLNEPQMVALLATAESSNQRTRSSGKQRTSVASGSSTAEPILLGTSKTSDHVSPLYHECQQRGLNPDFEFEGDHNGFQGSVTINGQIFSSDQQWPNKKEAKEGLSEKALPFVKALPLERQVKLSPVVQENWIGKLLGKTAYPSSSLEEQSIPVLTNVWETEYHNATSPSQGPVYTEYALQGPLFACTCQIPSHPTPFGSSHIGFPNKKAARTNAAQEAMQHIIAQGLTHSDGSLKNKKKTKVGTVAKAEDNGSGGSKITTSSQKVGDLSAALGLGAPFYQLESKPEAPSIFNCAAHYVRNPLFPKPLGEVRNIYGKKNAKEDCARGVLEVLIDLAKKRGVDLDEVFGTNGNFEMQM